MFFFGAELFFENGLQYFQNSRSRPHTCANFVYIMYEIFAFGLPETFPEASSAGRAASPRPCILRRPLSDFVMISKQKCINGLKTLEVS